MLEWQPAQQLVVTMTASLVTAVAAATTATALMATRLLPAATTLTISEGISSGQITNKMWNRLVMLLLKLGLRFF